MRAPSQPSPFSPELQTFILTKYDPLLTIVRELNETVRAAEKERFRLERRIWRLEEHVKRLQAGDMSAKEEVREELREMPELRTEDEQLAAPWLFSCQSGTPTASLQALLEFSPDTTEELDVRQWNSEEDMWVAFLEGLPPDVPVARPESLSLSHLRASARIALTELCKSELLLILRQVPGKEEVRQNHQWITFVAIMAGALSEAWNRVERTESDALGRLALVLEGENIGTRLRAGRNKFSIEPLN